MTIEDMRQIARDVRALSVERCEIVEGLRARSGHDVDITALAAVLEALVDRIDDLEKRLLFPTEKQP